MYNFFLYMTFSYTRGYTVFYYMRRNVTDIRKKMKKLGKNQQKIGKKLGKIEKNQKKLTKNWKKTLEKNKQYQIVKKKINKSNQKKKTLILYGFT